MIKNGGDTPMFLTRIQVHSQSVNTQVDGKLHKIQDHYDLLFCQLLLNFSNLEYMKSKGKRKFRGLQYIINILFHSDEGVPHIPHQYKYTLMSCLPLLVFPPPHSPALYK